MADEDQASEPGQGISQLLEIRTLLLADRAEVLNGKLYMMGGALDTFYATTFPSVIIFGIALVVAVPWNRTNEQIVLGMVIETADGQELGKIDAPLTVGRPPQLGKGDEQLIAIAVPNINIVINQPGAFVARSSLNGIPGPRSPFRVRQIGNPASASQ